MPEKPDFETMFHPKSVAIIGASSAGADGQVGGANFITCYQNQGFTGRIYPVNPKAEEILGLKAYPNVSSLPEVVDLAIFSIPARFVPQVLNECADAGIKNIHIYTAGFRETGEQEGIELEKTIKEIALRRKLTMVGPNCMGFYVPKSGISTWRGGPKESGPVAMLAQSGGMASDCSNLAAGMGIRFSKVVSFGNATLMDSTDFLEYLADDPETEIITMYLEGIGDGRKLTKMVREINPHKPVIILKGGLTESGARAVASHTGSLAGSEAIWDAFFRQTGALRAYTLEDLLDITMAFRFMRPLRGRGIALIGGGGGMSVAGADALSREGLGTPTLAEETRQQIRNLVPEAGTSIRNPLDAGVILRDAASLDKALPAIAADPKIDCVLLNLSVGMGYTTMPTEDKTVREYVDYLSEFAHHNAAGKPLAVVLRSSGYNLAAETLRIKVQAMLLEAKVVPFASLVRAARALSKFAQWHEFMARRD